MAESAAPSTPRRRSHRRLAVVLSVVLGLLLVRLWWGYEADRRMRRLVDDLRERGLPTEPEDFVARDVPPDQDGAARLQEILGMVNRDIDSPSASNTFFPQQPPFPSEWHDMTRKAMDAQAEVLRSVRSARACTQFAWPPPPVDFQIFLPARHLANLLCDAAVLEHVNGNDAAAIEYLLDTFWIADGLKQAPSLMPYIVGDGIDILACSRLSMLAPELRVAPAGPSDGPAGAAVLVDRERLHSLIRELMDANGDLARVQRWTYAERFGVGKTMAPYTEATWLVRPMYELEAVRLASGYVDLAEAMNQPNYPAATKVIVAAGAASKTGGIRKITSTFSTLYRFDSGLLWSAFTGASDRQMTATVLAVRQYRLDHAGKYPGSLERLIPDYLPAFPVDLRAANSRPIGYATFADRRRPMIYSVGRNDIDDTAGGARPSDEPHYSVGYELDDWRDLTRWNPPPKPTEKSSESEEAGDNEG